VTIRKCACTPLPVQNVDTLSPSADNQVRNTTMASGSVHV
jgi:hypothetical protein